MQSQVLEERASAFNMQASGRADPQQPEATAKRPKMEADEKQKHHHHRPVAAPTNTTVALDGGLNRPPQPPRHGPASTGHVVFVWVSAGLLRTSRLTCTREQSFISERSFPSPLPLTGSRRDAHHLQLFAQRPVPAPWPPCLRAPRRAAPEQGRSQQVSPKRRQGTIHMCNLLVSFSHCL
jgi:hypothetical protein